MTSKRNGYYLDQDTYDVLDQVIKNEVGISNRSQAIRYIAKKYGDKELENEQAKLNAMSKELSIVAEIVLSLSENMNTPIVSRESNQKFEDAKKIVEARIQKNKTKQMKYSTKPEKVSTELPTDNYFLNQI